MHAEIEILLSEERIIEVIFELLAGLRRERPNLSVEHRGVTRHKSDDGGRCISKLIRDCDCDVLCLKICRCCALNGER